MSDLPGVRNRRGKRVGRGYGSGKGGHTVGRGVKGQRSRGKIGILFEGVKVKKSLLRRLPLRRGKGKFRAVDKPIVVRIDYLNVLKDGQKVNLESLVEAGIVNRDDAERYGVKILGGGEIKKKLSVELPISRSAAAKVAAAGGKVEGGN
jgi:large subunit ribosomal protein L15